MKKTKNFYSIAITFCIIIFAALIIAVGMLTRPNTSSSTKLDEPIKLKDNWYIDLEGDEDQLWESLPYYNELRQDVFKVYNYLKSMISAFGYKDLLKRNIPSSRCWSVRKEVMLISLSVFPF